MTCVTVTEAVECVVCVTTKVPGDKCRLASVNLVLAGGLEINMLNLTMTAKLQTKAIQYHIMMQSRWRTRYKMTLSGDFPFCCSLILTEECLEEATAKDTNQSIDGTLQSFVSVAQVGGILLKQHQRLVSICKRQAQHQKQEEKVIKMTLCPDDGLPPDDVVCSD